MGLRTSVALLALLAMASCGKERRSHTGAAAADSLRSDSVKTRVTLSVAERERLREWLMREGRYDCCTKPGCTECITSRDSCGCSLAIKQKDPICGECLDGYKEGRGKFKLVSIVELEQIRNKATASNKQP
ncbi:MAG: hypothetical protein HY563_09640 [Ignavibacteriales bacterium]|nr:hypothetical protein [Ignavibacteriales bacterium]